LDGNSHHSHLSPATPNQPTEMSFENVADFNSFFDGGHEGSLSSNKENSVLRPRGEAQGQGSRPGGAIDQCDCSRLIYSPLVPSSSCGVRYGRGTMSIKVRPELYNWQEHRKCWDNRFKDYPEKHEVRSLLLQLIVCLMGGYADSSSC